MYMRRREVFVNGSRAGIVSVPPYRLDVTGLIHAGGEESAYGHGGEHAGKRNGGQ